VGRRSESAALYTQLLKACSTNWTRNSRRPLRVIPGHAKHEPGM